MNTCVSCDGETKSLLNLGWKPICNRYTKKPEEKNTEFRLALAQCKECSLVQLMDPLPEKTLESPIPMKYSEPEEHLNLLANNIDHISQSKKFNPRILGISFKDDSLLNRLKKGYTHYIFSESQFVNIPVYISKHAADYSEDIVIARHILEHARNPKKFLYDLKKMLRTEEGLIIIEVPDNTKIFSSLDYSSVWEEHVTYFTPETFKRLLSNAGFEIVKFLTYDYPLEPSMVAFIKPKQNPKEVNLLEFYAMNHNMNKELIMNKLSTYKKEEVAILGAGHLSIMFINIFDLKEKIGVVIDDSPDKQGMFLPGSGLKIHNSKFLKGKKLCLLAVNPRNEEAVINKHKDFKGRWASIFPVSKRFLL